MIVHILKWSISIAFIFISDQNGLKTKQVGGGVVGCMLLFENRSRIYWQYPNAAYDFGSFCSFICFHRPHLKLEAWTYSINSVSSLNVVAPENKIT